MQKQTQNIFEHEIVIHKNKENAVFVQLSCWIGEI